MTLVVEWVTKDEFKILKEKYKDVALYWRNHEFPVTDQLDFTIIPNKLVVSIRCDRQDDFSEDDELLNE